MILFQEWVYIPYFAPRLRVEFTISRGESWLHGRDPDRVKPAILRVLSGVKIHPL
jgi:hypothetical protein